MSKPEWYTGSLKGSITLSLQFLLAGHLVVLLHLIGTHLQWFVP